MILQRRLPLEVPQTQFIARAGGPSSVQRQGAFSGLGGDEGWAFFALLWVVPELSASFRSPMTQTRVSFLCDRDDS